MSLPVTVVTVHHKTPDLLDQLYVSLRRVYEHIDIIVVDGGSGDDRASMTALQSLSQDPALTVHYENHNIGHGPGMDAGIRKAETGWILTLDTDCVIERGGWIEQMLTVVTRNRMGYACGGVVNVDRAGNRVETGGILYCRPVTALWRRRVYLNHPRFELHGAPCLRNQISASRAGWRILDFQVDDYVTHLTRGTRSRHGDHWVNRGPIL